MKTCGVIVHQNYNQLFPDSEKALADQAKNKNLLGYHDIRTGNLPDERLLKFIGINLPQVLPEARLRFNKFKDLLDDFSQGRMAYKEFSARVRRRNEGTNEDSDEEENDEDEEVNGITWEDIL